MDSTEIKVNQPIFFSITLKKGRREIKKKKKRQRKKKKKRKKEKKMKEKK